MDVQKKGPYCLHIGTLASVRFALACVFLAPDMSFLSLLSPYVVCEPAFDAVSVSSSRAASRSATSSP